MAAQSLVLCRDPETLGLLRPLLSEFDMGVEVCLGLEGAQHALERADDLKTVIIDCDCDGIGIEFLDEVRRCRPDQTPVIVGLVNDYTDLQLAFSHGANFVLSKPISLEDAKRILRMARGFVSRMVRRFLRIAVHRLAHVTLAGLDEPAFLLDLSEGGMAVQALEPLAMGQSFAMSFLLPGTTTQISGTGQVIWADASGRAGLEFVELPEQHRVTVKDWIRAHSAPAEPTAVATTHPVSPTETGQGSPVEHRQFDFPDEPSAPTRVPTAGWMVILARAIDAALILSAAALFCFTVVQRLGDFPAMRWIVPIGTALAATVAVAYFALFGLLDVALPGTRSVELLLSTSLDDEYDTGILRGLARFR